MKLGSYRETIEIERSIRVYRGRKVSVNSVLKKNVAYLLAVVLFLSSIQGGQVVWAADEAVPMGFAITRKMLSETNKGLDVEERDSHSQESALVEWETTAAGHYLLQYYVEANGAGGTTETKKISVGLNTSNATQVEAKIQVDDGTGNITYVERKFNNAVNNWENDTTTHTALSVTKNDMSLQNTAEREKKELNVVISSISVKNQDGQYENLKLRMKLKDNKVYVFTNGINKGNITPFSLYYNETTAINITSPGTPIISKELFNGPKSYKIEPTHLINDGGTIKDITLIEDSEAIKPGSVPGVKLSFEQVKALSIDATGEKFKPVNDLGLDKKIIVEIGTKYSLDSLSNSLRLDFVPKDGKPVKINNRTNVNDAVEVNGNKVIIYLSSKDIATPAGHKSILWDKLATSTVVDASFQYNTQAEKYWPSNKGYTYLHYNINKTGPDQVQLNITPYNINARATYSVYILSDPDTERTQPSFVYEYDPNTTASSNITIPVPAHVPCYFQIVAEIDSNKYMSQTVYYDPASQEASPEVTTITSIDNIFVVPSTSDDVNDQPQAIGFDITWQAPDDVKKILEGGDLYYELLLRKDKDQHDPIEDTTNTGSDSYAVYSKIFKVFLEDGKVKVEPAVGTAGKDRDPAARYSEINKTFTMENVSIKNFGEDNWEQIKLIENHLDKPSNKYLEGVTVGNTLSGYTVPNNYYFSFRTVFIARDEHGNVTTRTIAKSEESNLVSVAFNNTEEIIPVPEKITVDKETKDSNGIISETLTIDKVNVKDYVHKMLEPSELYLYTDEAKTTGRYSGTYEIYFYQDDEKLNDPSSHIRVGRITEDTPLNLVDPATKYINELRNGKVLVFEIPCETLLGNGNEAFTIKGLDQNQVYYLKARLRLDPWRDTLGDTEPRYSADSKVFTFTTSTEPLPPSDDEKVPTAPEKIWVKNPISNDSPTLVKAPTAVIGWAPPSDRLTDDETITKVYYEFIRTEKELSNEEKAKAIADLVASDSTRVGFKSESVEGTEGNMSTYINGAWQNMSPAQDPRAFELTDNTLQTNKIYYYYVRTVCVYNNNTGKPVTSSWIMVPVTTTPVTAPINLKVETEKYEYDEKTEMFISFDVALPEGTTIGTDYNFDVAIKSEEDSEFSTTKYSRKLYSQTTNNPGTPEGYIHVVYKLSDLKPSKRYYVKVRTVDLREKDSNGNYVTSLYTEPVSSRTDYDEDQAQKDEKYEEYLKIFDQQVEKLRRKVYWTVEDELVYKYRTSYMSTDLAGQKEYDLVVEDNSSAYYYLPAAIFTKANEENVTLNISIDNYTASIRPYTLTKDTSEIAKAIDKVADGSIEDYYIAVSFKTMRTSQTINGETAITPELDIDMNVIYLDKEDAKIESDIELELEKVIADERKDFVKALEKKIDKDKISNDILNDLVEDAISEIEKTHTKRVKKIIDRAKDKTVSITTIEKAVLISAKVEGFAANGYYKLGGWFAVEVYSAGDIFYIEATRLGTYVLTGQKSLIDTVPSLAPYQSFIAQYGLTDFFTLDSYMIKTAVTKEQLYGAVARVMGAPRGTDYIVYLQNNKVSGANKIGLSNAVRQDEAVYVIMQAYEVTHNRKVASITIKNKQSVTNIGAFQPVYRDYVYAAVELKIIDNPDSKVIPSKQMTVEEIIKVLYKMQTS